MISTFPMRCDEQRKKSEFGKRRTSWSYHTLLRSPLLCIHTAGGESVKVAGSHSFSMWAGGELRREQRVLDDESVEESWNQVNFMVMSFDVVRRQPIWT